MYGLPLPEIFNEANFFPVSRRSCWSGQVLWSPGICLLSPLSLARCWKWVVVEFIRVTNVLLKYFIIHIHVYICISYIYICSFLLFSLAGLRHHAQKSRYQLVWPSAAFILVLAKEEERNVCKLFFYFRTSLRQLSLPIICHILQKITHMPQEIRTQSQTVMSTKSQELRVYLLNCSCLG